MSEALVMATTYAVKVETNYAVDPTLASANVIQVESCTADPAWDSVTPNEVANTKDKSTSIRTGKSGAGIISLNMRGCVTPGTAPEGDPLYECAIGVKNTNTATTAAAACTTTTINVKAGEGSNAAVGDAVAIVCPTATTYTTDTGSSVTSIVFTASPVNFSVGDIIQVPNVAGTTLIEPTRITAIDYVAKTATVSPALTAAPNAAMTVKKVTIDVTWITVIATDAWTVSPAVTAAPDQYTRIRAGVHYKLTINDLKSFWLSLWRGNITREDYGGNKIDSMEFDITQGGVIVPKFTFKGSYTYAVAQAYGLGAPSLNTLDPLVGVSQTIKIGGTSVECDKFQFRINNGIYDKKAVTSQGISKRIQTKRAVEGSFDVLYESAAFQTAFENDTTAEAKVIMGRYGFINGNCVAIRIPKMRYVKVPVTADNDLWKYSIGWEAARTAGSEASLTSVSFM